MEDLLKLWALKIDYGKSCSGYRKMIHIVCDFSVKNNLIWIATFYE